MHILTSDSLTEKNDLVSRYRAVRQGSVELAAPLTIEDQCIQTVADVSPTKWHLAHTSWFFETFILEPHLDGYATFDRAYGYLFNSYYDAVGTRHPRAERGLLSRPGVAEIGAYRRHVDAAMERLFAGGGVSSIRALLELGLNHEQQHQELLLMDIKHVFSVNPLQLVYQPEPPAGAGEADDGWTAFPGGLYEIGHAGADFAFDNEGPRHKVWLEPFALKNRAVTIREYRAFMEDGGYRRPEFWLSDGWSEAQARGWQAPQYWTRDDAGGWSIFTLGGPRALSDDEPACHVSFYEADAYARWAGKRLPREAEWEVAANLSGLRPSAGRFADTKRYHPEPGRGQGMAQMFGDVWEWTQSPYIAYPGFKAVQGAVGEYNGKFMSGQMVLRGGAAVTPAGHMRATYRNFFPPSCRLVFAGIRLADHG